MSLFTDISFKIFISAFVLLILYSIIGHLFEKKLKNKISKKQSLLIGFAFFLILSFSIVPSAIEAFLRGQELIGNGERIAFISDLLQNIDDSVLKISVGIWIFFAIGSFIALPVAFKDLLKN